ncbi:hypothetical protein [Micromonospora endophytica]|uniref:hypothetical protein n=1 Tax=Micromonospora endophytica TaxID=515350 RepID=UPI001BB3B323|nr:hypothetical protein [Micromonospora endophytica]
MVLVHQGADASLGSSGDGDGDAGGVGLLGGGLLGGGALGLPVGEPLGGAVADGVVRAGLEEGLTDGEAVRAAVEGTGARGGATRVGDGSVVTDGDGVAGAAGKAGGGSQLSDGSTNGMIVSGRTGPPAKLMPTIAVYATPSAPRKYAARRNHRRRRPLGSTNTGVIPVRQE